MLSISILELLYYFLFQFWYFPIKEVFYTFPRLFVSSILFLHAFIESEWFQISSEVYSELADLFVFPLTEQLGIDVKQKKKNSTGNK